MMCALLVLLENALLAPPWGRACAVGLFAELDGLGYVAAFNPPDARYPGLPFRV